MSNNFSSIKHQLIEEGLVKVPPNMLSDTVNFAFYYILKYIESKIEDKKKEGYLSRFTKEDIDSIFKKIRKKYRVIKPRNVTETQHAATKEIRLDRRGLPKDYKFRDKPSDTLYIYIDYSGGVVKTSDAVYNHKLNMLAINPNLLELIDLFRVRRVPELEYNIEYYLQIIKSNIEHELVHMVQRSMFAPKNPKTVHKKENYFSSYEDYITSPNEFEAQILTAVRKFETHIDISRKLHFDDEQIKRDAEKFVGLTDKGRWGVETEPFFKYLKNKAPAKWKIAYKKFMKEITNYMNKK